jgi:glycosyltransferase involved in cell wall biosynthesis
MKEQRIACVMEQTLGSVTHYLNLRKNDDALAGCRPRWLPVEYEAGRLPWTVNGSLLARRALGPVISDVDAVFIHTTTLAPLCVDYFARKPTVISSDGTPLNKRLMRAAYGLKPEWRAAENAKRLLYRSVFAQAKGFVAWSHWTKQSFVEDYGCAEQDVAVIPPGIDCNQFGIGERDHERPRILFVGNDFERKGGNLLLRVFRERLRGKAELRLITGAAVAPEPGVEIYSGLKPNSEQLLQLYRTSDILVLPTRGDCYPLVCMEALASGLPLVATRVGGISDMVQEGKTGHLVDVDDANALGDALQALVENPAQRRAMGQAGRQDALARFDARENARRLFEFVCSRA